MIVLVPALEPDHRMVDLVRDLLQAEWKVALEAFKSGRDKGIDLRYSPADAGKTTWSPGCTGISTPACSHQSSPGPTASTIPC